MHTIEKGVEVLMADRLGLKLCESRINKFKNQESVVEIGCSVRGDDVFIALVDVVDHARVATGDRVEYELVPNEVRGVGVKGGNVVVLPARTPAAAPVPRSVPADARTAALEAENEGLRDENERLTGEVSKLRRALRHAANMIDALGGAPSGDVGVDS